MAAIELDEFVPHPPGAVWHALTDSRLLARWLMPNDFEPRLGHRFTFDRGPALGEAALVHCQVLELRPVELLRFSWLGRRDAESAPFETTVTFRLVPEGRGTRVFLMHDGFDPDDPDQGLALRTMGSGWGRMLRSALPSAIEAAELPG